jgi:hypothetical protein
MLETGLNSAIDMMLAANLSTLCRIAGMNKSTLRATGNNMVIAVTSAGKIAVNTKMNITNAEMTVVTSAGMIIMENVGMKARVTVKAIVIMATARIKAMAKITRYPLYTGC